MNDYERVAGVIRYLDEHHPSQPTLDQMAAAAGLSVSHFHRLFRRWAAITPKDFVRCLTAEEAKRRLRASQSVLDTALDVGLSGPGRLHDLMVQLEAASPGEIKSLGAGLEIRWGRSDTPFGMASLGWTTRGICHLTFVAADELESISDDWMVRWAGARIVRDDSGARVWSQRVFRRAAGGVPALVAYVNGTPFQIKVWRALVRIPPGYVATYGQVARLIGLPGASRAVGSACGVNPVAYLIPCHRVIRETGVVEGYRWGTERKRAMLGVEAGLRSVEHGG